jgi:hypothetical protein
MSTRIIGGWALLINALVTLFILIGMTTSLGGANRSLIIIEALSPLFIVGLLAIWAMQPHTGRLGILGLTGLCCLGIGAVMSDLVRLVFFVHCVDVGTPAFISALFGLVGSILVGWVTIKAAVFHPAIGWLLIVGGVLNVIGGLLLAGVGSDVVAIIATLAQAGAVAGYGWTILRGATYAHQASIAQR